MAKKDETQTEQAAAPQNDGPMILTKMSVATMGCAGKKLLGQADSVNTLVLARIYGVANAIKAKENKQTGEVHIAIIGTFEGIAVETGEVFRSAVLYLPSGIHEMLEAPLRDGATAIEFGFDIAAVRANNAAGYSYAAKPIVKPQDNDALSGLRSSLPALPAPKK